MIQKTALTLSLLLAAAGSAYAQSAAPASSPVQSSPAKKELVARVIKLQQPGIEGMARGLVEQPAAELLNNVAGALPNRIARDKQDAVAKEIQGDVQKYLDESTPIVLERAVRLAPATIGPILEEKFSEDELKQVVAIIESPVYSKFQRLGDDMQKALAEKLLAETRGTVEPKVRALQQTVAKRLGVTPSAQGVPAAPAARPPAKAASR